MSLAPKRRLAVPVGAALKRAMARRGATSRDVAECAGVTLTMARFWISGRYLPSLEVAERLTEWLGDETIVNLVRAARNARCAYLPCGRPFDRSWRGGKRVFCSDGCRKLAYLRPDARRDDRQTAIDAFCRQCEPDQVCRTADCPLRAFSPYLYVPLRRTA